MLSLIMVKTLVVTPLVLLISVHSNTMQCHSIFLFKHLKYNNINQMLKFYYLFTIFESEKEEIMKYI